MKTIIATKCSIYFDWAVYTTQDNVYTKSFSTRIIEHQSFHQGGGTFSIFGYLNRQLDKFVHARFLYAPLLIQTDRLSVKPTNRHTKVYSHTIHVPAKHR